MSSRKRFAPIRQFVYHRLWDPLRSLCLSRFGLTTVLRSGLKVSVRNFSDWIIFNEILVNGEYDTAIEHTLSQLAPGRRVNVVDLGANVGFFVYRFADALLHKSGPAASFRIYAVEGSPVVFGELKRRIAQEPLLGANVELCNALVGRRCGEAYIGYYGGHYGNSMSLSGAEGGFKVPFVDLSKLLEDVETIDLLKCDIEGAEFDFVEEFPEFFRKVKAAVFEFHNYGRSIADCRKTIMSYGLTPREVLRQTDLFTIELFAREPLPNTT